MNAHDIAIELEHMVCKELGLTGRPSGTIFDADEIELRMFYDIINLLLYLKSSKDYTEFVDLIYEYKSKNMNEIDNYEEIYNNFISFL